MLHTYEPPDDATPLHLLVEFPVPLLPATEAVTKYVSPLFNIIGKTYANCGPLFIET